MSEDMKTWVDEFNTLHSQPNKMEESSNKSTKENKNVFGYQEITSRLDSRDINFYSKLTEKEQKTISMWVFMRVMSASYKNQEHYILMVNDLVNVNFSSISKHPDLQWKLLALCGIGKTTHPFLSPPKKAKKNKIEEILLEINPLLKNDELELLQTLNTKEEFREYFASYGLDDKAIKEVLNSDL